MDDQEVGVEPELVWGLLLSQIVYDEAGKKGDDLSFDDVAAIYRAHPLLPQNSPVLASGAEARDVFNDLLKEYNVDPVDKDLKTQSALLAEPLYVKFHVSLLDKMKDDTTEFTAAYRQFEVAENIPQDERLKEA